MFLGCITKCHKVGVSLGSDGETPETKPLAGLVPWRHEAGPTPASLWPWVAAGHLGSGPIVLAWRYLRVCVLVPPLRGTRLSGVRAHSLQHILTQLLL